MLVVGFIWVNNSSGHLSVVSIPIDKNFHIFFGKSFFEMDLAYPEFRSSEREKKRFVQTPLQALIKKGREIYSGARGCIIFSEEGCCDIISASSRLLEEAKEMHKCSKRNKLKKT